MQEQFESISDNKAIENMQISDNFLNRTQTHSNSSNTFDGEKSNGNTSYREPSNIYKNVRVDKKNPQSVRRHSYDNFCDYRQKSSVQSQTQSQTSSQQHEPIVEKYQFTFQKTEELDKEKEKEIQISLEKKEKLSASEESDTDSDFEVKKVIKSTLPLFIIKPIPRQTKQCFDSGSHFKLLNSLFINRYSKKKRETTRVYFINSIISFVS
jgi:hypothetical protein